MWDATAFTAQKEFPYGNAIYALTWSPDGRWLAFTGRDYLIANLTVISNDPAPAVSLTMWRDTIGPMAVPMRTW